VAAAQKTPRRTAIAKTRAKNKAPKRQPVKVTFPQTTPAPSLYRPVQMPGFLIVGIGASAGGLEAMEEVQGREGEGKVQVQVERNPEPEPHSVLRRTM
jgi:chemotaxis response regulator CheB